MSGANSEEWRYPNLSPKPFEYKVCPSLLDEMDPRSAMNQSNLRGFYNLAMVLATIFFITQPIFM